MIYLGTVVFNGGGRCYLLPPMGFDSTKAIRIANVSTNVHIITNVSSVSQSREYLLPGQQMVYKSVNVSSPIYVDNVDGSTVSASDILCEWASEPDTDFQGTYPYTIPTVISLNSNAFIPMSPLLEDTFSLHADGPLAGVKPVLGNAWLTTGTSPTVIAGGYATSGLLAGYAYQAGNPDVLECVNIFEGTSQSNTMAWSSSTTFDLANMVHINFGPLGFTATLRQDGGTFDQLMVESWVVPLDSSGTVPYRFMVAIMGEQLIVTGPNGDYFSSPVDPRIAALRGKWYFWEPGTSSAGNQSFMVSVSAYNVPANNISSPFLGPVLNGQTGRMTQTQNTLGAPYQRQQVSIGQDPVTNMPAVIFGATTIFTQLTVPANIGDTTITTLEPIPLGSTFQIESGNNSETGTTSGSPVGTGPYVQNVTVALTKAHLAGVSVIATPPTQRTMYYNTENDRVFFPNTSVLVVQQNLYFTTNVDTFINRSAAGVTGIRGVGAGKGALSVGQGVTANVPTAANMTNGGLFYNTTVNAHVASDGTHVRQYCLIETGATGDAVLVGGTIAVTGLASVTANSIIRLSYKTIGGTPGAVFISAKVAGTGFTITSTSTLDTSAIHWEIITY